MEFRRTLFLGLQAVRINLTDFALWVWVIVAFIAYLHQFLGIFPAVLKVVGITL